MTTAQNEIFKFKTVGIKFWGRESTGAKIFPGGRKISKCLASGWKLSFILLVKKILQFLPNLSQNLKSLYLII